MKQARTLTDSRHAQALKALDHPRDRLMYLLSSRAGLRAVEIAGLKWDRIDFDERILRLKTTKGKKPRAVPIASEVFDALKQYEKHSGRHRSGLVFTNTHSRPGQPLTPNSVAAWFRDLYKRRLGWEGYSSHSGRRTFCTKVARKITEAGGSLKDVQALMGHESLQTTSRYIDTDPEAQRRVVDLI